MSANQIKGINEILGEYFPKGDRNDYSLKEDYKGHYHVRTFVPRTNAKAYAIAHFLRFVHPFNYFLCPKKTCEINNKCTELAEYPVLLNYVHDYNLQTFGDKYLEFLELVMPLGQYYNPCFDSAQNDIFVRYGLDINKANSGTLDKNVKNKTTRDSVLQHHSSPKLNSVNNKDITDIKMALEYLINPNTSFRQLEKQFLNIDSPVRGGGFIAKRILNSMGIKAYHKGMLKRKNFTDSVGPTDDVLLQTLEAIKKFLEKI